MRSRHTVAAALTSPVVAFNITFLLSFPLCALAGYWLCHDLTHDRRAAFIGGLVWGFFPQPSRRNAAIAGVALAVAATIHPINVAYFLLPFLFVVISLFLWDTRQPFNLQSLISNLFSSPPSSADSSPCPSFSLPSSTANNSASSPSAAPFAFQSTCFHLSSPRRGTPSSSTRRWPISPGASCRLSSKTSAISESRRSP
ncbi:MAG: hypothetical protein FJ030_03250 [Chloroflexi bacterium]|nr:hypothetical protein [Chloroflexota bacterium]